MPDYLENISGKVALVTGGSMGIGRGIALALARAGSDAAIVYYAHEKEARLACDEILSFGRRTLAVRADVSHAGQVSEMVAKIEKELGPVQILVNNAGISRPQKLEAADEATWDQVLDTNLKSAFLVTQAVLPVMRARHWGRIINISSVAGHIGGLSGPHYAASKAGMFGLTHYYAAELAGEGITANVIAPALIETDMLAELRGARPEFIPVGRFGRVEEVAEVALLLATNGYITGQTINVDGGKYMA